MKCITAIIQAHLLAILIICVSCKGLNKAESVTATGKTVATLDEGIMVVFQDKKDNFWFGSKNQGVYKYDGENLVLFSIQDGLSDNAIVGIQEDNRGNIYFDTPSGVSQFDGHTFTTLIVIDSDSTQQEWTLEPHDLWFNMGWGGNGPYRYDGQSLYSLAFPRTSQADAFYARYPDASYSPYGIYTMYKDRKGLMWFGTAALGVCRYDGKSHSWLYEKQLTETSAGGDFGIRSIIEDKDGYFWFCNSRYRYEILPGSTVKNGTHYINYSKENGVSNLSYPDQEDFPYFMSMVEGEDGDLWMVTYDDGVWQNNGKELIHYPVKDGEKNVLLFSIYKDHQADLWLGTHNGGVYKFNGSTFEKFIP
jgi:ligand-binding sensor domain-containing protein